jgi:hypothetical protein
MNDNEGFVRLVSARQCDVASSIKGARNNSLMVLF